MAVDREQELLPQKKNEPSEDDKRYPLLASKMRISSRIPLPATFPIGNSY